MEFQRGKSLASHLLHPRNFIGSCLSSDRRKVELTLHRGSDIQPNNIGLTSGKCKHTLATTADKKSWVWALHRFQPSMLTNGVVGAIECEWITSEQPFDDLNGLYQTIYAHSRWIKGEAHLVII